MSLADLRGRLARLTRATLPAQSPLPAGFIDPITEMLRGRIAAGEPSTPTTPEARAEALARVDGWLARGRVRT